VAGIVQRVLIVMLNIGEMCLELLKTKNVGLMRFQPFEQTLVVG
jgi:hypothetical protein